MKIYLATQPKPDVKQQQTLLNSGCTAILVSFFYFKELSDKECKLYFNFEWGK
tara:strand:- start:38168 stop:38326 length:159 start_codon:yes stop_codon:yes gene_type:complete